jgi:NADPH-dependent 2,4-dienoyl-CoA reductase/sulfur reductase-like enzyme
VCLLRSPDDANYIAETAEQRDVVIVGTSFIGMEAAAYLVDKAASVTVVGRSSAPFSHVFGGEVFIFGRRVTFQKVDR